MLDIEYQRGEHRAIEPGTAPGILAGQRGGAFRGDGARGGGMGDGDAMSSGVLETEGRSERSAAALPRNADGTEPGAGDQVDGALPERRAGEGAELPAEPIRKTLHRKSTSIRI